jgi:hypothetical protein
MFFAQSILAPEVAVACAIAAFLVLLVVDLWSAPACHTQEETSDLAAARNKPSSTSALQNR